MLERILISSAIFGVLLFFLFSLSPTNISAQDQSTFSAKPSNVLPGGESFYAFHLRLINGLQGVDNFTIRFSPGFDASNAQLVKADGNPTLFAKKDHLIFKLNPPTNVVQTILVDGIVNTRDTGVSDLTLTAERSGRLIIGPLSSKVNLPSLISTINNNSITSNLLTQDSITGRELGGISKILYFNCVFRPVQNIPAAKGVNIENHGWVTIFGKGPAKCNAPNVEEGELAMVGQSNLGGGNIMFSQVRTYKDTIQMLLVNPDATPFGTTHIINAPVIVFKK